MKVIYIPTLNWGVTQWRIEYPAREMYKQLNLKNKGAVYVDYLVDPRSEIAWDYMCVGQGESSEILRDRLFSACKMFDVIVFQKIQHKQALVVLEEIKKTYPKKLYLAEIDDSVGEVTPSNYQINQFKDHHGCAAYHLEISDGVICSTEYLADSIKKFNKNTYVYPNCINYDLVDIKRTKNKNSQIRIGYVAAGAHDEDLLIAYRAMCEVLKNNNNVKFVIRYGGFKPSFIKKNKNIDFMSVQWPVDKYFQKISELRLDIALAPLRDTEFNRCKSNLKWIEWSSFGVPLVASNTEPFKETNGTIWLSDNNIFNFSNAILDCMNICKDKKLSYQLIRENKKNYNITNEVKKMLGWMREESYKKN